MIWIIKAVEVAMHANSKVENHTANAQSVIV